MTGAGKPIPLCASAYASKRISGGIFSNANPIEIAANTSHCCPSSRCRNST